MSESDVKVLRGYTLLKRVQRPSRALHGGGVGIVYEGKVFQVRPDASIDILGPWYKKAKWGEPCPGPFAPASAETPPAGTSGTARIAELERELRLARSEAGAATAKAKELAASVVSLSELLRQATTRSSTAGGPSRQQTEDERLYAEVGLVPTCPSHIIKPARTAFRKENHPDRKPPAERPAAEETFKRIDAIFGRILRARGLPE